jgi:hypothetical protein
MKARARCLDVHGLFRLSVEKSLTLCVGVDNGIRLHNIARAENPDAGRTEARDGVHRAIPDRGKPAPFAAARQIHGQAGFMQWGRQRLVQSLR